MNFAVRYRVPTAAIAAVLLLVLAQPAEAMRCGNRLVTEGMHISKVIALCGEPSFEETRTVLVEEIVPRTYGGRRIYTRDERGLLVGRGIGPVVREVRIRELTYNFGPFRLMRLLTFRDGVLDDIRELGYGYRESQTP